MSYICLECGNVFENQETIGCPYCGGAYEESIPCVFCGRESLEDDLNGDLCDDCVDKYKNDIFMCFNVGKNDTESVEINCFLACLFEKDEIEEILFEELKSRNKYSEVDCEKFINSDRAWFAEMILEELRKEKK